MQTQTTTTSSNTQQATTHPTSAAVAQWLATQPHVYAGSVTPCSVTIGRTTYHGAHYWQQGHGHTALARAQGAQQAVYLVGIAPAAYPSSAYVFCKGSTFCFYVAGIVGRHVPPFGACFVLMPNCGNAGPIGLHATAGMVVVPQAGQAGPYKTVLAKTSVLLPS